VQQRKVYDLTLILRSFSGKHLSTQLRKQRYLSDVCARSSCTTSRGAPRCTGCLLENRCCYRDATDTPGLHAF